MKRVLKRLVPSAVWDRARAWYHHWRYHRLLAGFPRREVEHTYARHRLQVLIADPDGADWYDKDWPAWPEIDLLARSRLQPSARVFNVGSHQGVVALILARTVGPTGAVVAVDPHPFNLEVAERNKALNRADNVTLRRAAVGAGPGIVRMGYVSNDRVRRPGELASGTYKAEVVSVDQLATEYGAPDVAFVDVEGFESFVLDGAARTRAAGRTDWFVEVHTGLGLELFGKTVADVLAYFPEPDYDLFVGSDAERQFVPLAAGRHLLAERFFLIALDRRPPLSEGKCS